MIRPLVFAEREPDAMVISTLRFLLSCGLFGLLLLPWGAAAGAADDQPIRVGVLGLDNYQAVAFTQLWHQPKDNADLAGLQVVAAVPLGSSDIPDSPAGLARWPDRMRKLGVEIVDSIDAVLERADAVVIMSLDGRSHLEQVRPALEAGKPVYVARPLAASLADAIAIFELSEKTGTPIFSCSQHRFSPGFIGMRNHPEVGQVLGCDVYGGLKLEPTHADFFWHGVHSVETLFTIMGAGCETVTRASTDDFEKVTGVWKDGRIGSYRGIKKGAVQYSAIVFGDKGVSPAGVYGYDVPTNWQRPKGKYMGYEGVATEIAKFFKTKKPPVSAAETIEIFAFMEAAHESKRRGGVPVKIADVLEAARKSLRER